MKILIVQENGRKIEDRHMRECHSLAYYFNFVGVEATCWGKGHENFSTPFEEIVKDYDIIFCLENYDSGWLPDIPRRWNEITDHLNSNAKDAISEWKRKNCDLNSIQKDTLEKLCEKYKEAIKIYEEIKTK